MIWRWMEGMRATNGARVINVCDDGFVEGFLVAQMVEVDEECEPDWADPATMGCLLAQVHQAFSGGRVSVFPVKIDEKESFACWHYKHDGKHLTSYGETEVAALLAALQGNGV